MPYNLRSRGRLSGCSEASGITESGARRRRHDAQAGQAATAGQRTLEEGRESATDADDDQLVCAICLEIVSGKAIVEPCMHCFDFVCIEEWVKCHSDCPVCRVRMERILHDIRSDRDFKVKPAPVLRRDPFAMSSLTLSPSVTLIYTRSEPRNVWIWTRDGGEILTRDQSNNPTVLGVLSPVSMYRLRGFDMRHQLREPNGVTHHLVSAVLQSFGSMVTRARASVPAAASVASGEAPAPSQSSQQQQQRNRHQ